MDLAPTLLHAIDPCTDELRVVSADDVDALTLEARKTAWLLNSSWEDIRTGLSTLPDDIKSLVDDELEDRLNDAWDDLRSDGDPSERPQNWLPNDEDYGPPPFNSDWMSCLSRGAT